MDKRDERKKLFFYDSIADSFDLVMNRYDLERRLDIVFERFLSPEELIGCTVLDVGSGTGWFSQRAVTMGSRVVSLDIGVRLLKKVREKCPANVVAGDACCLPFSSSTFDVVISSECIEHTIDPKRALEEMCRVLRPGGTLVVTVPNRLWRFSVMIAALLKVRPYEGFEHWVGWRELKGELIRMNLKVISMVGFHLFPPIIRKSLPFLQFLDRLGGFIGPVMLNIAVKARK